MNHHSQDGNNKVCAAFSLEGVKMERVKTATEPMLSGYQQTAHNISGFQRSTLGVFNGPSPRRHTQT